MHVYSRENFCMNLNCFMIDSFLFQLKKHFSADDCSHRFCRSFLPYQRPEAGDVTAKHQTTQTSPFCSQGSQQSQQSQQGPQGRADGEKVCFKREVYNHNR